MSSKTMSKTQFQAQQEEQLKKELWKKMAWSDKSDIFIIDDKYTCKRDAVIVRPLTLIDEKISKVVDTLNIANNNNILRFIFFTVPIIYHCSSNNLSSPNNLTIHAVRIITMPPDVVATIADILEKHGYDVMIGDPDFEYYVEVYLF